MANLKEIRNRLASVKTTRQITSAMKMVSAAKLRKAQDAIIQMRPYANTLLKILGDLAKNVDSEAVDNYKNPREVKKALFVVITSNKGLCGAFNSNIVKQVIAETKEEYTDLKKSDSIDILCIGKKGAELLKSKGINVTSSQHGILDNLNYQDVKKIAYKLTDSYLNQEYDLIKIFYNQFKNAATQIVISEQYLPIAKEYKDEVQKSAKHHDYILEPSKEEIITELIPKSLKIQLFKALLDSNASEQGARMTAMHKATDNATELIKSLQLEYNKARQASITNEILEIVGGADALKG
jgi:F-type H+-transporting ATPase subunit gamma